MSLPRALLLDLDDTIIDDSGSVQACWRAACEHFAGGLGVDAVALHAAIEPIREWYWSDPERHRVGRMDLRAASANIVELALRQLGVQDLSAARKISDAYRDRRDEFLCLFPGATDALQGLRDGGVQLALLTNGSAQAQRAKIERFSLAAYFDCILVEGEFGVGKPDERVYRHALDVLGSAAEAAWMAGDNLEWDVAAPQRLGMVGIWVDGFQLGLPEDSPVRPDRIISCLADLLEETSTDHDRRSPGSRSSAASRAIGS